MVSLWLYLSVVTVASAQTILYVVPNGVDAGACTVASPCASLRYAAEVAGALFPDVTIMLSAGQYGPSSCNTTITGPARTVRLIGAGVASTRIDCQYTSRVLQANVLSISITNLTVIHGYTEGLVGGGALSILMPVVNSFAALAGIACLDSIGKHGGFIEGGGCAAIQPDTLLGLMINSRIVVTDSLFAGSAVMCNGELWLR